MNRKGIILAGGSGTRPRWTAAELGITLRFEAQGVRLRVDFNGVLDRMTFEKFVEFMPLRIYRALDFVEDPFPYDAEAWEAIRRRWGVALALDKGWKSGTHGFDAVVVKPAPATISHSAVVGRRPPFHAA
jgi:O-succinylbenzoate synthase